MHPEQIMQLALEHQADLIAVGRQANLQPSRRRQGILRLRRRKAKELGQL